MRIIIALIVFGLIVLVHEFGHFMFAKKAGIKVHEFSIGMGPKIYSIQKETMYSIRLLPIGGYVAMEGEDADSEDPNSFGKKTLLQRFLTIFAGPFFNIVLTILLFIPVYATMGVPTTTLETVIKDSPAYEQQLQKGDTITEINGVKIKRFEQIGEELNKTKGSETQIQFDRDGKNQSVTLKPDYNGGKYVLGMQPQMVKNPAKAVSQAFLSTIDMAKAMVNFLGKLVTGQLGGNVVNSMAGPVGVIKMMSTASKAGIINVLYFMAIISLNLGIINLMPFPALDGWRILMLAIEGLRGGKKLDPDKEGILNTIGFVVLMGFMVFITYKDILRLF